jgi:acyl-CoA thioesterase
LIRGLFRKKIAKARLPIRKSSLCLSLLGASLLLLGLMFTHAYLQRQADALSIDHMAGVVGNLELTDLCLFTEARYTRHLSQADLHSAFQDHPLSLEHFPAGSIAGPPAGLRR